MKSLFETYLNYLLHPFRTQEFLESKSRGEAQPWVYGREPVALSLWESIGVSWMFAIVNGIFSLFFWISGKHLITALQAGAPKILSEIPLGKQLAHASAHFWLIFVGSVLFFPLTRYINIAIWKFLIQISNRCFGIEAKKDDRIEEILIGSNSSYMIYPLPIFGGLLQRISEILLLFAGLTKRLNMTTLQAVLVMFMPALLGFIMVFSFGLVVSIFWGFVSL